MEDPVPRISAGLKNDPRISGDTAELEQSSVFITQSPGPGPGHRTILTDDSREKLPVSI